MLSLSLSLKIHLENIPSATADNTAQTHTNMNGNIRFKPMAVNVEAPSLMLNAYRVDEKAHP
jgi:hypothetical protein